jgi:ribose/xylose/arabinose/galactoside ABC-type transport system permease subunit
MRVTGKRVTRKILLISLATSVVLFVIAIPFGNGKNHHSFGYVFGNVVFTLFLISVPVFLVLVIIAVVQAVMARRRTSV